MSQTQTYPDGALSIYRVKAGTPYGRVTDSDLELVVEYLRYADRRVGMSRFWTGWSAGERIDRMVRVQKMHDAELATGMVVKLYGASSRTDTYYTVLQVQPDPEAPWQDLSLGVMGVDKS